jgi:hypothetical protein
MFNKLPQNQQKFLKGLIACIILIYIGVAILSINVLRPKNQISAPNAIEKTSLSNTSLPPVAVTTGIYLDGIESFSIKDSSWGSTFYVWFRWKGNQSLDPGKTFQLVDAKIDKKELQDSFTDKDGTNYQCYKIVAKMMKFFNTAYLPLDEHTLNIQIEDAASDSSKLVYIPDQSSNIATDIQVPSFNILGFKQTVTTNIYPTTYGDPRLKKGDYSAYSQYSYDIRIKRNGLGFFFKLFLGMFAGVALALASFFIRPSEMAPRIGLPSAAYFGAIGNMYMVSSITPPSGQFDLTDLVTGIGFLTITLCVAATLFSSFYYLRKDQKQFSWAIDLVSFTCFGSCYLFINCLLMAITLGQLS